VYRYLSGVPLIPPELRDHPGFPDLPELSDLYSRRSALWLMGAAGLTVLAADGAVPSGTSTGSTASTGGSGTGARSRAVVHPSPTPKPVPKPRPASWTRTRLTTAEPKKPISDLGVLVPPPPAGTIALTIDDGPSPKYTPKMLDLLAEHDVRATFFTIGSQVKANPKLTRRIVDAGHQICNHTMTHPISFEGMSRKRIRKEVGEAHDRIADVSGVVPTFFRAPGGNWTRPLLDEVSEHGMLPLDWTVDPRDWARPGVGRIRKLLVKSKSGNILLVHDGGGDRSQTLKALRDVIPTLKQRGLTFVSL
jgi:peptidoglycan/xylan/chitin deacetylase (PgdA/CDA1 family)